MRAELRDSLEFLFPDSLVSRRPRLKARLDVPRGGTVSVHVLLNQMRRGRTVRLLARGAGGTRVRAEWFRLLDVPVEINTGPRGFVETKGQRNRYVIRRAPFRVYDAMMPVERLFKAAAATEALRVHLPVPASARAGVRRYSLEISSAGRSIRLELNVNVRRPVVPPAGGNSLLSVERMASRHGLEMWSQPHWRMIRRYADMMIHARQNAFWCPLRYVFAVRRGRPILDRERLRRYVRTFTAAGLHYIIGGHFAKRTGDQWDASTFDLLLTGNRATSPAGNADLACIARQLMDEIGRNGWQDRWIQHVADEPIEANAADYRILTGMVHKYMPRIPVMDATLDASLVGSVDIWCPQGQRYQARRAQFEAVRALGDKVWFYTCCFPGGPWLNRLLDMELLRPALLGWYAALYDLDGFLHWGLNQYPSDEHPYSRSITRARSPAQHLPAGDTHIVYPGDGGPWSSLRLEAQREGLEDYELLKRLRATNEAAALRIIRKAVRGFASYTKDVKAFRAARRQLLIASVRK